MPVEQRIVGVGKTLIDYKISSRNQIVSLKEHVEQLQADILTAESVDIQPGGMTPNMLAVFTELASSYPSRLLACVGQDQLGDFYQRKTAPSLGQLQRVHDDTTGIIALVLDEAGIIVDRYVYHGAANRVRVVKEEAEEKNGLLVTDLTLLTNPSIASDMERLLPSLKRSGGQFVINLAGAHSRFGKREEILRNLYAFGKEPDLVFGNEEEYAFLTNTSVATVEENLQWIFPNSRLVVVTQAERGALIRFEGRILHIPPVFVQADAIIDETGAGDCFEGTMLAYLYAKPYYKWNEHEVLQAGKTAAFAIRVFRCSPEIISLS
ncbi:MAG: carbohydrate kinase family protein [Candidatus Levybacteria bacterium]|nr:carbohydrate kinase family protein [Candidatus Levybacteria bacterium]